MKMRLEFKEYCYWIVFVSGLLVGCMGNVRHRSRRLKIDSESPGFSVNELLKKLHRLESDYPGLSLEQLMKTISDEKKLDSHQISRRELSIGDNKERNFKEASYDKNAWKETLYKYFGEKDFKKSAENEVSGKSLKEHFKNKRLDDEDWKTILYKLLKERSLKNDSTKKNTVKQILDEMTGRKILDEVSEDLKEKREEETNPLSEEDFQERSTQPKESNSHLLIPEKILKTKYDDDFDSPGLTIDELMNSPNDEKYPDEERETRNEDDDNDNNNNNNDVALEEEKRSMRHVTEDLWTGGRVPYAWTDEIDNNNQMQLAIFAGMKQWMEQTCVRFEPFNATIDGDDQYIHFTANETGCWSYVGRIKKIYEYPQPVSLQRNNQLGYGCMHARTVAHELGHVLGLDHEQNRKDRDDYVNVYRENIIPYFWSQFTLVDDRYSDNSTYDYGSVMHYGPYFFSKFNTTTGQYMVTIEPKNECYFDIIGRTPRVSFWDAWIVNQRYNCTEGLNMTCPDGCYPSRTVRNPTGECQCPRPYRDPCKMCYYDVDNFRGCSTVFPLDPPLVCGRFRDGCCGTCVHHYYKPKKACPQWNLGRDCYLDVRNGQFHVITDEEAKELCMDRQFFKRCCYRCMETLTPTEQEFLEDYDPDYFED